MKIKSSTLLISLVATATLFGCSFPWQKQNTSSNTTIVPTQADTTPRVATPTLAMVNSGDTLVSLKTKNGQIVLKLYPKEAPNTVKNFLQKAKDGFYDNLKFHRVIQGFMAQGGDPSGDGTGSGKQKSELNSIPFKRGSLGLARTAETKDYSSDSQFFICFTTQGCQHLTGEYVNFGEVVSGLDVLDKIAQNDLILEITNSTK